MKLLNININNNKPLRAQLNLIEGINSFTKNLLQYKIKFGKKDMIANLPNKKINHLKSQLNQNSKNYGNQLKILKKKNIISKIQMKAYSGYRHLYGYPVRGQRTRSNHVTAKKLKIKI